MNVTLVSRKRFDNWKHFEINCCWSEISVLDTLLFYLINFWKVTTVNRMCFNLSTFFLLIYQSIILSHLQKSIISSFAFPVSVNSNCTQPSVDQCTFAVDLFANSLPPLCFQFPYAEQWRSEIPFYAWSYRIIPLHEEVISWYIFSGHKVTSLPGITRISAHGQRFNFWCWVQIC